MTMSPTPASTALAAATYRSAEGAVLAAARRNPSPNATPASNRAEVVASLILCGVFGPDPEASERAPRIPPQRLTVWRTLFGSEEEGSPTQREASRTLVLSLHTVCSHAGNVRRDMGASSIVEAHVQGVLAGLLPTPSEGEYRSVARAFGLTLPTDVAAVEAGTATVAQIDAVMAERPEEEAERTPLSPRSRRRCVACGARATGTEAGQPYCPEHTAAGA